MKEVSGEVRPEDVLLMKREVDACIKEGKWQVAESLLARLARLEPSSSAVYMRWGYVLYQLQQWEKAIACYLRVWELTRDSKEALKNLLILYCQRRQTEKARVVYRQGMAFGGDDPQWCYGLGVIFHENHYPAEAIAPLRRALELNPEWDEAHWLLGVSLLKLGRFSEGFFHYEWRKVRTKVTDYHRYFAKRPQWQGEIFSGKKLLVYAEQGLGDFLQFMRYLPMVKARGGMVAVYVRDPLRSLVEQVAGIDEVVTMKQSIADFDLSIAMLSLPQIFGTSLATIPQSVPYVTVEAAKQEPWRRYTRGTGLKVGLVWGGNTSSDAIAGRSMPFSCLSALQAMEGVCFYSLQKGEQEMEGKIPPIEGIMWTDLAPYIGDFYDTAAAISQLDLVITVDTASAHLAGAMGKEVWVLLPFNSEWRWLVGEEASPWYPSMRLFRQSQPGDWHGVMGNVVKALSKRVSASV